MTMTLDEQLDEAMRATDAAAETCLRSTRENHAALRGAYDDAVTWEAGVRASLVAHHAALNGFPPPA